jgi:hypothetical protein
MQHESNHTPNPDGTASLMLACLEHTWQTIRTRHSDVPEAVLVVASGPAAPTRPCPAPAPSRSAAGHC